MQKYETVLPVYVVKHLEHIKCSTYAQAKSNHKTFCYQLGKTYQEKHI